MVGVAKGDGDGDIVFGRERDAMLESRGLRVNFEGERSGAKSRTSIATGSFMAQNFK